jgi:hypothetical protein
MGVVPVCTASRDREVPVVTPVRTEGGLSCSIPSSASSSLQTTVLKQDPLMDELVLAVSRSASLSPEQATQAVASMLRFLAARLPSPLFGELQVRLNPTPNDPGVGPLASPRGP